MSILVILMQSLMTSTVTVCVDWVHRLLLPRVMILVWRRILTFTLTVWNSMPSGLCDKWLFTEHVRRAAYLYLNVSLRTVINIFQPYYATLAPSADVLVTSGNVWQLLPEYATLLAMVLYPYIFHFPWSIRRSIGHCFLLNVRHRKTSHIS